MSEFSDLEKKADSYADQHPETADKGIGEAAKFAERETGHEHDSEIQHAADAAEQHFGDQPAGQGQGESQGGQGGQGDQGGQG